MDTAVKNLLSAHKTFLQVSIDDVQQQLQNDVESSSRERMSALNDTLTTAQVLNNKGEFKIDSVKVLGKTTTSRRLSTLARKQKMNKRQETFPSVFNAQSLYHESWAPYGGTTNVRRTYTLQTFYFNDISSFGSNSTYEHETQVYNINYANYGGYWSSNMPSAYYDTPFADTIDNFTVGTSTASSLQTYTQYYTYMTLTQGSASGATVRIKGQKGHRTPSWCYSTWCIFADATTSSMVLYTVPSGMSYQY